MTKKTNAATPAFTLTTIAKTRLLWSEIDTDDGSVRSDFNEGVDVLPERFGKTQVVRVVYIDIDGDEGAVLDMPPDAARALAELLIKAADAS